MASGKFTNDISCIVCENRNEPNPPKDPGVCKHCKKAQQLHNCITVENFIEYYNGTIGKPQGQQDHKVVLIDGDPYVQSGCYPPSKLGTYDEFYNKIQDGVAIEAIHKQIQLHNLAEIRKDFGITGPTYLKGIDTDELHNNRQVNKKFTGPALLMELFGKQLQIGKEKGYKDGSWKQYVDNNEDVLPSLKRHLVGVEISDNDGWYTEHKPNGEACETQANHAYALFWNAAVLAMQVYNRSKK